MKKLIVMDHPLVKHKMGYLKDERTETKQFRELVNEISMMMAYEATKDMMLKEVDIKTPLQDTVVQQRDYKNPVIVPILRAGLGMVDGMLQVIPTAKVGHIGLYRDEETLEPVEYYCKLPVDISERELIVVDPMLATGGSAKAAIQFLKDRNVSRIKLVCILGCPEGVEAIHEAHPDVDVYLAQMDPKLNDHGYILPGLGDAGDRLFGTK
ncbi:uracil phosphoribosyltransferase [Andreesenia angusta]|uniref:Uracil phosphoribosyltransferase n=1 Tax=Andreesenia angusta TaxID=39480 RepID=A0A1S1V674_9FIRM|nr:uracil phosphoribosyltransferase [Andreesenia angusta]OHW61925.1 uracil phosphoribosyltransferase [Andreesenia angusta]